MDADLAGAAQEKDGGFIRFWDSLFSSEDWSFDVYYVDQEDRYEVELTDNFNLKYQAEFHNSRDLAAGDVEIRMPASLCLDRTKNRWFPRTLPCRKGRRKTRQRAGPRPLTTILTRKPGNWCFSTTERWKRNQRRLPGPV